LSVRPTKEHHVEHFNINEDLPVVNVTIGHWTGKALIDTGSSRSVAALSIEKQLGGNFMEVYGEHAVGIGGITKFERVVRTSGTIMGYDVSDLDLYILSKGALEREGFKILLGADFLRAVPPLVVDYQCGDVYFSPALDKRSTRHESCRAVLRQPDPAVAPNALSVILQEAARIAQDVHARRCEPNLLKQLEQMGINTGRPLGVSPQPGLAYLASEGTSKDTTDKPSPSTRQEEPNSTMQLSDIIKIMELSARLATTKSGSQNFC
jgi:hypothetical protein